jgi:hypothetical protein
MGEEKKYFHVLSYCAGYNDTLKRMVENGDEEIKRFNSLAGSGDIEYRHVVSVKVEDAGEKPIVYYYNSENVDDFADLWEISEVLKKIDKNIKQIFSDTFFMNDILERTKMKWQIGQISAPEIVNRGPGVSGLSYSMTLNQVKEHLKKFNEELDNKLIQHNPFYNSVKRVGRYHNFLLN